MSKTILAVLVGALIISGALYLTNPNEPLQIEEEEIEEEEVTEEEIVEEENGEERGKMSVLVDCLKEKGVVVYGSRTCPACAQFVDGFGGHEVIAPIYVECTEEMNKCAEEKATGYVPEIQIKGVLYDEGRAPSSLAEATGCEF